MAARGPAGQAPAPLALVWPAGRRPRGPGGPGRPPLWRGLRVERPQLLGVHGLPAYCCVCADCTPPSRPALPCPAPLSSLLVEKPQLLGDHSVRELRSLAGLA